MVAWLVLEKTRRRDLTSPVPALTVSVKGHRHALSR
ncbi:hypothetical protein QFZ65_002658 [Arthrobacter sp. B3I9]|nr:hypothetical protein [Arthrobacter sp. B3I9]